MSAAPDIREQEDCPSSEACGGACDQHEGGWQETVWERIANHVDPDHVVVVRHDFKTRARVDAKCTRCGSSLANHFPIEEDLTITVALFRLQHADCPFVKRSGATS